jgi:signal transduction histidine kinase
LPKVNKLLPYLHYRLIYLNEAAKRSADYSKRHFRLYGIIAFISPVTTLIDYLVATPFFNTFVIRAMAVPICLPALYYAKLGSKFRRCFHWYFVVAAAFLFPFSFGLMLILNAAFAPKGVQIDILWILQYFIALFVFIQVIYNSLLSTVLWFTATAAALSSLLLVDQPNVIELKRVLLYPLAAYLTAVGLGSLTNRQTDILDTARLKAASAIGANLAHELRTPLASIRALSGGVDRFLPTLVEAYKQAAEAGLDVEPLRPKRRSWIGR